MNRYVYINKRYQISMYSILFQPQKSCLRLLLSIAGRAEWEWRGHGAMEQSKAEVTACPGDKRRTGGRNGERRSENCLEQLPELRAPPNGPGLTVTCFSSPSLAVLAAVGCKSGTLGPPVCWWDNAELHIPGNL